MAKGYGGKPLKGIGSSSERGGEIQVENLSAENIQINNTNISDIFNGSIVFDPIDIKSGTVDGTSIGSTNPGPGRFTTLQTGSSSGLGHDVVFFGNGLGNFVQYVSDSSTLQVNGSIQVRDPSSIGNLDFNDGKISSQLDINLESTQGINLSGDSIDLTSNGLTVNTLGNYTNITENHHFSGSASYYQETSGEMELNTLGGNFSLITESAYNNCVIRVALGVYECEYTHHLVVSQSISFRNGTIGVINEITGPKSFKIAAGPTGVVGEIVIFKGISLITSSGVGTTIVTTLSPHYLKTGQKVEISNSIINGLNTVLSVISPTRFSIARITTVAGNTGNLTKVLDRHISLKSSEINLDFSVLNLNKCGTGQVIINSPVTLESILMETELTKRGIDFNNPSTGQVDFFGINGSCFEYTNNGVLGCLNIGAITASSLNLQGGSLANVGNLTLNKIVGDPDLTLEAPRDIILKAGSSINIPTGIPLEFSNATNRISHSASTLEIRSSGTVSLAGQAVSLLGTATLGLGAGLFNLSTPADIDFHYNGNFIMDCGKKLYFSQQDYIYSDCQDLILSGGAKIILDASDAIVVPEQVPIQVGDGNIIFEGGKLKIINDQGVFIKSDEIFIDGDLNITGNTVIGGTVFTLVGTTGTTVSTKTRGSLQVMVEGVNDGSPCAVFLCSKSSINKHASIVQLTNSPGSQSQQLRIDWNPSQGLRLYKTLGAENDDYIVKIL